MQQGNGGVTDLLRREIEVLNDQLKVKDEQLRAITSMLEAREKDIRDKDALLLDLFFKPEANEGKGTGKRAGIGMAFLKRIEELESQLKNSNAELAKMKDAQQVLSTAGGITGSAGDRRSQGTLNSPKGLPSNLQNKGPLPPTPDYAPLEKVKQLDATLAKTVERLGGLERMMASYYKHDKEKKGVTLSVEEPQFALRNPQLSPRNTINVGHASTPQVASQVIGAEPVESHSSTTREREPAQLSALEKKMRRYTVEVSQLSPSSQKKRDRHLTTSPLGGPISLSQGGDNSTGNLPMVVSADSPIHLLMREGGLYMDVEAHLLSSPLSINEREPTPASVEADAAQSAEYGAKIVGGETPLIALCGQTRTGTVRMEVLKFLLGFHGIEIDAVDNAGRTALHGACLQPEGNNSDVIQLLIKQGADITKQDKAGNLAFHYLARQKPKSYSFESWKKSAELFLERFPVDTPSKNNETVMHHCAQYSNMSVFNYFLERKPNINIVNKEGETVLHAAIKGRNIDAITKMFDTLGVDPRIPASPGGKTPTQLARTLGPQGKQTYDLVKSQVSALDMKGMSADEKKVYRRKLAVDEIVETEMEYLDDLDILIRVFLGPLKQNQTERQPAHRYLGAEEYRNIFGHIEEIREVSAKLYADLKKELDAKGKEARIGKVMLDNWTGLQKYERVCMRQQSCTEFLQSALDGQSTQHQTRNTLRKGIIGDAALPILKKREPEKTEFAKFCERVGKVPECRQMDISSFLFKPFQRCTKYPLLIRELLSYTDEKHGDYRDLVKLQEMLEGLIDEANEKKRATEELYKLLEIQNSIYWEGEMVKLGNKDRRFITELSLQASINADKMSKHHLFVFSDLLLCCKSLKRRKLREKAGIGSTPIAPSAKYTFLTKLELSTCTVEDTPGPKPTFTVMTKNVEHTKKVSGGHLPQKVLITANSPEQKIELMRMFADTISGATLAANTAWSSPTVSERKSPSAGTKADETLQSSGTPTSPTPTRKERQEADVLYAFNADFKNALHFKPGDVITILEKDKDGDGWWLGDLNGVKGFFPATHVRIRERKQA